MKILFRSMLLLTLVALTVLITACGKDGAKTTTTVASTTTTEAPTVTTTWEGNPAVNLQGEPIVIMCQIVAECDPFDENYVGKFQAEKQALQEHVEAKYNTEIQYTTFPTDAGWGPSRYNKIIQSVTSGAPLAHIYQLTTQWIPPLVQGNGIVPVTEFIQEYRHPLYDEKQNEFGKYLDEVYGFDSTWVLNDTAGLYYNMDLLEEIGLESPAELWNKGEWTFSAFRDMVLEAQTALDEKETKSYAIGGSWAQWAQNFIGANGGYLVNPYTTEIAFHSPVALEAVNFLHELHGHNVWEPNPAIDQGSPDWFDGNILFHFGEMWFNISKDRWGEGKLGFEVGYVPWPIGDDASLDDYRTPKMGQIMWFISGGYDEETAEGPVTSSAIFRVWNELQYYQTYEDRLTDFEITIMQAYDDPASVQANLSIIDKVYNELLFSVDSSWDADEWYIVAGQAVMNGDVNSKFTAMKQLYDGYLAAYKGEE